MGQHRTSVRRGVVWTAAVVMGAGLVAVSTPTAAAAAPAPVAVVVTKAAAATCQTGKYQKDVESYLRKLGGFGKITVDGKQSAADCAAIKLFQSRYGIKPVAGLAGPTTYGVARRLARTNPASCKASKSGTTFCVDLTNQTAWVMSGGKVKLSPAPTRTGMKGYRTPTGTFKINKRTTKEWSNPYHVWMPYWQRFVGGVGFHQTTTYLHDGWRGSHGCVNLLALDAARFYKLGKIGSTVKVFGRRPGT